MIAWSIEAAQRSQLFDRVIVSTDDDEIASIASASGAEVPFRRPASLSDDRTGTTEVIAHSTRWALDQGWSVDAVCCIYATAPFVDAGDLARGWQMLAAAGWQYVFAATEFPAPIFRSFKQHDDGGIEMFFPEHFHARSQDLPLALHDAGQFYWGRPQAWLGSLRVFERHSSCVRVPRWRVQDIDSEDDWRRAESMAAYLGIGGDGAPDAQATRV
jgi:pseudaminic acid cytidylyltransferase